MKKFVGEKWRDNQEWTILRQNRKKKKREETQQSNLV